MNILDAQKKAERLSREFETMAVVYLKIDVVALGQHMTQYDACLYEQFTDEEDIIEMYYSKGKPVSKDFV
jgi:hypothetical protein